jgi:hypothetical protein
MPTFVGMTVGAADRPAATAPGAVMPLATRVKVPTMPDDDQANREFNATANRLIRREQLRRAAADLNSTSAPALEHTLADISAEVTEEAAERLALAKARTAPHPSKPGS